MMFHYTKNCTLSNLQRERFLGSVFPFSREAGVYGRDFTICSPSSSSSSSLYP